MGKKIPEVDVYIEKSEEFARPILKKLRTLFHKACPAVEEEMKWSFPHFLYHGILGSIAAFKEHVSYGFWKGELMKDPHGLFRPIGQTSMCASRVQKLEDLPPDTVLIDYIKEAMMLNETGATKPKPKKKSRPETLETPDFFAAALKKNKKAQAVFDGFNNSQRKEYIEWLTEAKQETTRQKRLETAIEWISEGKPRHWKYQKPK